MLLVLLLKPLWAGGTIPPICFFSPVDQYSSSSTRGICGGGMYFLPIFLCRCLSFGFFVWFFCIRYLLLQALNKGGADEGCYIHPKRTWGWSRCILHVHGLRSVKRGFGRLGKTRKWIVRNMCGRKDGYSIYNVQNLKRSGRHLRLACKRSEPDEPRVRDLFS